jgi:hypothetical protein
MVRTDIARLALSQAIHQLNQVGNVPQAQRIIEQFTREVDAMELRGKMTDEAMDMIADEDGTIEEEGAVKPTRIFSEMGVPMPPEVAANLGLPSQTFLGVVRFPTSWFATGSRFKDRDVQRNYLAEVCHEKSW